MNRYHNWTIYLRKSSEFILLLLYSQSIMPFMISYHLSTLGFYFSCENFNLFLQHVSHSDGAACKWVASGWINHLCLQFLRYFWGRAAFWGCEEKRLIVHCCRCTVCKFRLLLCITSFWNRSQVWAKFLLIQLSYDEVINPVAMRLF